MKPAPFAYHAPSTQEQALSLLSELGDDAKVLAGGQSLVPLMNFRLARPAALVDINRVAGLNGLRVDGGALRIGATVRQREMERSAQVAAGWPLLVEAVKLIGHTQIRNRGTIGGSLAHADPAAELPAVMTALDAEFVLRRGNAERRTVGADFFVGYLTTALEADELLTEIQVPALPRHTGSCFQEISRRHGDFALVGVAALLTIEAGAISRARVVFTGTGPTPLRSLAAESVLVGQRPGTELFAEAGSVASAELDPETDIHASAHYRRQVAAVLARRALTEAAQRAASAQ